MVLLKNISEEGFRFERDEETRKLVKVKTPHQVIGFKYNGQHFEVDGSPIKVSRRVALHGIRKTHRLSEGCSVLKIVELPEDERQSVNFSATPADYEEVKSENEALKKKIQELQEKKGSTHWSK